MVSKSQIKLITSLQQKKFRLKEGLFIVEGPKSISEFIEAGYKIHSLFSTEMPAKETPVFFHVTAEELQRISGLKAANTALALFEFMEPGVETDKGLILVLDAIRDPGNLGTIIRLCDWFGVTDLVCSPDTVDCFNPKVVQASMGSLARINVRYIDLTDYLNKTTLPIYGGVLNGNNIYSEALPHMAVIVMGNEANGISEEITKLLTHKITIPHFGTLQKTESLNVATASAIILSEFRRSIEK